MRTLAAGTMTIVAPISGASAAVIPVLFDLSQGTTLTSRQWFGIALAVAAVLLVGAERGAHAADPRIVARAMLSGATFGFFFIALSQTSTESGLWPLVGARLASVPLAFVVASVVERTVLAGMRLVKVELLSLVAGTGANLALNWLLIPLYGIAGASFASMLAYFLMTWINQHYAGKYAGFRIPQSAWKNVLAGVAVTLALWPMSVAAYGTLASLQIVSLDGSSAALVIDKFAKLAVLSAFFAAGCAIYLLLLNMMRLFEHEDARVFQGILKKFGMPHWINMLATRMVFWNQKEIH